MGLGGGRKKGVEDLEEGLKRSEVAVGGLYNYFKKYLNNNS
jgi:hypothetical protein